VEYKWKNPLGPIRALPTIAADERSISVIIGSTADAMARPTDEIINYGVQNRILFAVMKKIFSEIGWLWRRRKRETVALDTVKGNDCCISAAVGAGQKACLDLAGA
jgi:hypothetical protein